MSGGDRGGGGKESRPLPLIKNAGERRPNTGAKRPGNNTKIDRRYHKSNLGEKAGSGVLRGGGDTGAQNEKCPGTN